MYSNDPDSRNGVEVKVRKTGNRKLDALLQELSDGEDDSDSMLQPTLISRTSSTNSVTPSEAANEPWRHNFHAYLNSKDHLGDMTIVQWWGINAPRYPVWASLARDFLSIMATSVSSERAFSSAGITISKRRNRLKHDIVEALQCLKCMIKHDLLFRKDPSVATEFVDDASSEDKTPAALNEDDGWDDVAEDLGENEELLESDDEDVFIQMLDEI